MLAASPGAGGRAGPAALAAVLPLPRTGAASRGAWAPLLRLRVRPSRLGAGEGDGEQGPGRGFRPRSPAGLRKRLAELRLCKVG